jgi:uncharacterized membrane protein YuzA (DUF378 family)
MKITCILCSLFLGMGGIFAAIYGLFGFNLLLLLCAYNQTVFRVLLSLEGVAAAWLFFWLIAFRPQNNLK